MLLSCWEEKRLRMLASGHLMSCLPGMHMMSLVSNRDAKMDLKIRGRVLSNLLLVGDAKFDDYDN